MAVNPYGKASVLWFLYRQRVSGKGFYDLDERRVSFADARGDNILAGGRVAGIIAEKDFDLCARLDQPGERAGRVRVV